MFDTMKNDNELISIAMATYNGEKYLSEQLDSLLCQTHRNIEIVIADDCSKDSTVAIIEQYQQENKNIRLLQNEFNSGIAKTFEKAILACKGNYIALSDQDDIWFHNKLEILVDNIGDNLLIHSDAVLVDEKLQVIAKSHFEHVKDASKTSFLDYLWSNNMHGCTAMFNRRLIDLSFPIPDGFYVHDHYIAICAAYYGSIKLHLEPLIYYRQHQTNSTGANKKSYFAFLDYCKKLSDSYTALLTKNDFRNNTSIKLLRDYRMGLCKGTWQGEYSKFKLLSLKNGWKHLIFYFLMKYTRRTNISIKIYNVIRTYY